VNKNSNEMTNGHYALAVSHRNIGAYLNFGGGRDGCFSAWSAVSPVLSNNWNHLAMTYDGRELKVYCNGTLHGSALANRPRTPGNGLLRIGKRADGYGVSLHGLLDELRIYSRALSAEELRNCYQQPRPADMKTDPTLVAYWPFDDLWEKIQRGTEAGLQEPYRSRLGITAHTAVSPITPPPEDKQ
jgi:hypothetical protein